MNRWSDNRWYVWVCILLIVVITLPYILGFALQTDDYKFSGSFIGVDDQNSYLAKMRAGYEGEWLNQSPYTNYPQNGVAIYLPFVYLGKLAGGDNLVGQLQFLMLMLHVVSAILYFYAIKKFFDYFLEETSIKKIAMILVLFGSGFGFLYFTGLSSLWGERLPLEIYSPEAFSFLALLTLPHIIIARSFLLLSIVTWFSKDGITIGKFNIDYKYVTIIYSYFIYLFQPIDLPILFGIIAIQFLLLAFKDYRINKRSIPGIIREEPFRSAFVYYVLMLPAIAYNLYLLMFDSYIKAWGAQNKLFTAPIQDYLLAYGVFLLFSVIYFVKAKNISTEQKTLGVWIVISLIGIYLPISIQRRFIEGSWIFISLFTILGLEKLAIFTKHKLKMRIGIIILCFSSLFLLSGSIFQILSMPDRVFVNKSKLELYNFINDALEKHEFIFTNHDIGNEIPVWTSNRTITGVGPESINEQEYLLLYQDYVDKKISDTEFEQQLSAMEINYFVAENSKRINCDLLFRNDEYSLCRVGDYE